MTNGTKFSGSAFECPVHGCEHSGDYTFGQSDSHVFAYPCGCGVCEKSANGQKTYWTTYKQAAAVARGEVARMDVAGHFFSAR